MLQSERLVWYDRLVEIIIFVLAIGLSLSLIISHHWTEVRLLCPLGPSGSYHETAPALIYPHSNILDYNLSDAADSMESLSCKNETESYCFSSLFSFSSNFALVTVSYGLFESKVTWTAINGTFLGSYQIPFVRASREIGLPLSIRKWYTEMSAMGFTQLYILCVMLPLLSFALTSRLCMLCMGYCIKKHPYRRNGNNVSTIRSLSADRRLFIIIALWHRIWAGSKYIMLGTALSVTLMIPCWHLLGHNLVIKGFDEYLVLPSPIFDTWSVELPTTKPAFILGRTVSFQAPVSAVVLFIATLIIWPRTQVEADQFAELSYWDITQFRLP